MTQRKLNVSTVKYTVEDRRSLLKRLILDEWLLRNQPSLIKKVEKYVKDNVTDDDVQ